MPQLRFNKGNPDGDRIEQIEPGNITILRDRDGRRVIIVRDPNGKTIVKQRLGDDGPAAKPSPDQLRDLDDLKQKLQDDADDDREKPLKKDADLRSADKEFEDQGLAK